IDAMGLSGSGERRQAIASIAFGVVVVGAGLAFASTAPVAAAVGLIFGPRTTGFGIANLMRDQQGQPSPGSGAFGVLARPLDEAFGWGGLGTGIGDSLDILVYKPVHELGLLVEMFEGLELLLHINHSLEEIIHTLGLPPWDALFKQFFSWFARS